MRFSMQTQPRITLIITTLVSLLAIAALSFVFIFISRNIERYHRTLSLTVMNIEASEKNFNHFMDIANLLETRSKDIARIQRIAIDRQRPLQFIETIEQIARITHTQSALGVNEIKDDKQSLLFHVTWEGEEKNVRTMLALLQKLPFQIVIQDMSFQKDILSAPGQTQTSGTGNARLVLSMKIKTQ